MGWVAVMCTGIVGAATALVTQARMRNEPVPWGAVAFGVLAVVVFATTGGNA